LRRLRPPDRGYRPHGLVWVGPREAGGPRRQVVVLPPQVLGALEGEAPERHPSPWQQRQPISLRGLSGGAFALVTVVGPDREHNGDHPESDRRDPRGQDGRETGSWDELAGQRPHLLLRTGDPHRPRQPPAHRRPHRQEGRRRPRLPLRHPAYDIQPPDRQRGDDHGGGGPWRGQAGDHLAALPPPDPRDRLSWNPDAGNRGPSQGAGALGECPGDPPAGS
jgi:hypothetical protein